MIANPGPSAQRDPAIEVVRVAVTAACSSIIQGSISELPTSSVGPAAMKHSFSRSLRWTIRGHQIGIIRRRTAAAEPRTGADGEAVLTSRDLPSLMPLMTMRALSGAAAQFGR